jgi:hypothetical protein
MAIASVHRQLLIATLVVLPRLATGQGDPLGPEFRVNTYTTGRQGPPSVAADSAGNFLVVWASEGQDGSLYGAFGQRYLASGMPLGPEFRANTYTTGYQMGPIGVLDGTGGFVVVWASDQQDGSSWGIFAQRFDPGGAPVGPEFRVNTFTTGLQAFHSAGSAPDGSFVVVWSSYGQDGSDFGVFGQRYDNSGVAVGTEFRVNTFTTGNQWFVSVGVDSLDNFVVAWTSDAQDGSASGIVARRYAASGVPLGPEFVVNTYTTGYQSAPSVAVGPAGDFVVTWQSYAQDGANWGVFGQRYASTGGPLGPEFRVNSYTTDDQEYVSVAADPGGNFVIVWTSEGQDGSFHGVFGKRFTSAGVPLGDDFQVNTYTYFVEWLPSVAVQPSGDFIVVWESSSFQEPGAGSYGQRFGRIVPVGLLDFGVE